MDLRDTVRTKFGVPEGRTRCARPDVGEGSTGTIAGIVQRGILGRLGKGTAFGPIGRGLPVRAASAQDALKYLREILAETTAVLDDGNRQEGLDAVRSDDRRFISDSPSSGWTRSLATVLRPEVVQAQDTASVALVASMVMIHTRPVPVRQQVLTSFVPRFQHLASYRSVGCGRGGDVKARWGTWGAIPAKPSWSTSRAQPTDVPSDQLA